VATQSKLTLGDELRMLETGMKANLTDVQTLIVGGVTYTLAEAIAKIDGFLQTINDTTTAKNSYHTAVTTEKTYNVAARAFRTQMQGYVVARYGKDSPKLAEFSFTPSKPKKTTTAIKAIAVAKVKATRAARHTMGKKQKLKVTGVVDPALVAALSEVAPHAAAPQQPAGGSGGGVAPPPVAPPAPAPAPSPAPVAVAVGSGGAAAAPPPPTVQPSTGGPGNAIAPLAGGVNR
jgi:hypothetical protein